MQRRHNPYPALLVVALVPALVLGAIWKLADSRQPPGVNVSADDDPPTGLTILPTPLLSVRRAPSVLARDAATTGFDVAMAPVYGLLGDTSCVAVSVDRQLIASKNDTVPLLPSAAMQVLTAAVALEVLGASYRFSTVVQGDIDADGVVAGNLFLVGGGDPLLTNWWSTGSNPAYPPTNRTTFDDLTEILQATGVTRVRGSVVGDASRYLPDEELPFWGFEALMEAGPVSALMVNDGMIFTGKTDNPPAAAAAQFTTMLEDAGIRVDGDPKTGRSNSSVTLATLQSSPLPMILQEMLATSDANTAEMLLREIGIASSGIGSREAGLAVMTQKLKSWGVDTDDMWLFDGSGLSQAARLTCGQLLQVLQHGSADDAVGKGMAVAGTATTRMGDDFPAGSPLAGSFRGVLGTQFNFDDGLEGVPGVKSLVGYLPLADGRVVELAMLLNGPQMADPAVYGPVFDALGTVIESSLLSANSVDLGPR